MKLQKLLKKLALPVFALAVVGMLAACSSPSGGGSGSGSGGNSNTPVTTTPLVDESEVTVSASKIELSDGNWSYKEIGKANNGDQEIREAELTVSENGSVVVYTSMKKTNKGTIPAGLSDEQIAAAAKEEGVIISGNTYTSTKVYSNAELEEKNEHAKYAFSSSSFKNIKTNSDKTKYSWINEETQTSYNSREDAEKEVNGVKKTVTYNCYLVKKSSASSSDAHNGEGEGHKPQGGESGGNTGTTTGGKYKIEDELLGTMTVIAGNDGTYVVKAQGMTVEEGKYVLNGDKVTTTTTKELNEAFELVSVTKPTTTTYTIGANNVLTEYKGSSGTGTGTGTGTSQSGGSTNTETIDGTYEGTITGAGNSLYASVEISGKTYSVKMWTSSAKTGNPFQTSSGTISTTQKTVKGMMFGGTGTDHTFTAQPNGNNGWTVTIILFNGSSYSGTMTKGSSGSNGGDVTPVNPNNPGTTIPEGEFPFDSSNMYFIKYGNENPVPVPADYVDEILKGLSASDYDKDDTNKTITFKSEAAVQTAMSNYESVMLAAGYEPMED